MTGGTTSPVDPATGERRALRLWIALLLLALVVGTGLIGRFAGKARDRDLEGERARMSLIADGRADTLAQWLAGNRAILDSVAANPATQLYVLSAVTEPDSPVTAGQVGYLRTQLQATAQRLDLPQPAAAIRADVPRREAPGLAIVAAAGRVIAAYGGPFPMPQASTSATRASKIDGTARLAGGPAVAWQVPIAGPQADETAPPLAVLTLVRPLDETVARRLVQPGDADRDAETVLVRTQGDDIILLAGRTDAAPGSRAPASPALRAALARPGHLVIDDDGGRQVLALARPVAQTGWSVVRLRDADAALAPINSRYRLVLASLVSGLAFAGALILLAWRHGASLRVARAAAEARDAAAREHDLRVFLERLASRQPNGIAALDAEGRIRFLNPALPLLLSTPLAAGDRILPAFGDAGARLESAAAQVRAGAAVVELREKLHERTLDIAIAGLDDGSLLLTLHDLTELERAREKREAHLQTLIDTLTGLIDARDPDSAQHSHKVARLAQQVAATLEWSPGDRETARVAGLLMNLGKLFAPRALLTKAGAFTPDELALVRAALAKSSAILRKIDFDGPVADTIARVHDIEGADDTPGALVRLLRLVNRFVSLTSNRAFRPPMGVEQALDVLRGQAGAYDLPLIAALAHCVENQGGRALLQPDRP